MAARARAASCAFVVGTALAYWMYIARAGRAGEARWRRRIPGLHQLLLDKWRVDELYDATVIAMVDALADTFAAVDQSVVDGILARLTALVVAGLGDVLRAFQNGVVHVYAAIMVVGLAAMGWFFVVPHAERDGRRRRQRRLRRHRARPGIGLRLPLGRGRRRKAGQRRLRRTQQQLKVHLDAGQVAEGGARGEERLRARTA